MCAKNTKISIPHFVLRNVGVSLLCPTLRLGVAVRMCVELYLHERLAAVE